MSLHAPAPEPEPRGERRLPKALAPWAPQLAPFATDLALALGEWARRIAPALGSIPQRRTDAGEPDGLSGLTRRGPYERLLVSEWLLASELPDEFLRRAAAREHLFLARARRRGGAGRRTVALFDAGPDQLGAPRIAQLAVLIVLAARAEAAGAELLWGAVQEPEVPPARGFDADLALRFLAARTRGLPGEAALEAWRAVLAADEPAEDLWLVGGPRLAQARTFPEAPRLRIEDVADPGVRQVRLALERRSAPRRELVLELPAPADCVRLLRDPFRAAQTKPIRAPGKFSAGAPILLAPFGRRAAVRLENGAVLDVHVPNSPREKPGKARVHAGGPGLLAFGWWRGKAVTASARAGEIRVFQRGGTGARLLPGKGVPLPAAPGAAEPPGTLLFGCGRIWLLDGAGTLYHAPFTWSRDVETAPLWISSLRAAAVLAWHETFAHVAAARERLEVVVQRSTGRQTYDLGEGSGRAFLSRAGAELCVAAEEKGHGLWRVWAMEPSPSLQLGAPRLLRPPSDTEVVGLTSLGGQPTLVLLESDRRDFTLLSQRGLRLAFAAPEPVAAAAVSPAEATVVCSTRSGGLVAWSLDRNEALLRMQAGGGA